MKKLAVLSLSLLAGCATCDRHPAICGTVIAIAVGSAAACLASHNKQKAFSPTPPTNNGGNIL